MSTTYNTIERRVSTLLNNLSGSTASDAETTYTTVPLTISQYDNAYFPPSVVQDAIVDTEARIVEEICLNANHPHRTLFADTTADLTSNADLPTTGASGAKIIGPLGDVYDSTNLTPLTKNSLKMITLIRDSENGMFQNSYYFYCISDRKIYHTRSRPGVKIAVCTFARSTFASASNLKTPDEYNDLLVYGTIATLAGKVTSYEQAGMYYAKMWDAEVQKIRNFGRSIDPTKNAAPSEY